MVSFCRVAWSHIPQQNIGMHPTRHGLPIYSYHTHATGNAGHFSYHTVLLYSEIVIRQKLHFYCVATTRMYMHIANTVITVFNFIQ